MDAVKQIFYAFGDRTGTLDNSHGVHKLGLISFDDRIEKMLDLTNKVRALDHTCLQYGCYEVHRVAAWVL